MGFARLKQIFKSAGPGIITGAADDDPSGIGTYSVAGAQFGYAFLWTALITWPLMATVQMVCARIGLVTGAGLAAALRKKIPRSLLIVFCIALFFANTLNVGADLAAMADSAGMLSQLPPIFFILAFGFAISWATVKLPYDRIASVLKWLALALFSYIIVAFSLKPDWSVIAAATLRPELPRSKEGWGMLVAILGTTISPYLFFWQAAVEVEEQKMAGKTHLSQRIGASEDEIFARRCDVGVGTLLSNVVMFFIILATALTLNAHGLTKIETTKQAAEALLPIAGRFSYLLYSIGLLGVGFLAIPTLTGSAAFALAETFHWRHGLSQNLSRAKSFYSVILGSMIFAMFFDLAGFNPIKTLYWSAVINGLLAPFILAAIFLVIRDKKLMAGQPSGAYSQVAVGLTTVFMFAAAVAMFFF